MKLFLCSLCVAVVVHRQTHTHSQNSYIMSQPLLYGEYLIFCHGFKNGIQKSGQSANPDLNVKVLNKVTRKLFDWNLYSISFLSFNRHSLSILLNIVNSVHYFCWLTYSVNHEFYLDMGT